MNKERKWITSNFDIVRMIIAILSGALLAVIVIFFTSEEPLLAIQKLFFGPLQSTRRFGNVIELMIPLTFAGLSVAVMFKANQFNMSTEGAFYAGGATAALVSLTLPSLGFFSPIACVFIAGIIGGCICLISGFLKVKFNTNELVTSLMLNYVVFYLFKYFLLSGDLKDPKAGYVATYLIPENAVLDVLIPKTRIHAGIIIMIITIIVVTIWMKRARSGFALLLTGENQEFARYAGINIGGIILLSQFIGGFLGGMGGAVQVLGMFTRFQWVSLPGYGFDGIIVAILARKNPLYVPIAAFFLAYLRIGSDVMSTATDVTNELVAILQGVIILFISANAFLEFYRQKLLIKEVAGNE